MQMSVGLKNGKNNLKIEKNTRIKWKQKEKNIEQFGLMRKVKL